MKFSEDFNNLVEQQLGSLELEGELENIVVYIANTEEAGAPTLEIVGQRSKNNQKVLIPIANDPDLRSPSPNRRWYPLQNGSILLGVLRAERFSSQEEWPQKLEKRLQASATALAKFLGLEIEKSKLLDDLNQQKDQIGILVHQLRNPLTALRTYAQLLLRKLGPESSQRNLVEGLLNEHDQVSKYLNALDRISESAISEKSIAPSHLLLPPLLPSASKVSFKDLLEPLIDRAAVTANLQSRKFLSPTVWPDWAREPRPSSEAVVGEIVANLLENAFRYSPKGCEIGISLNESALCVWDSGFPIPLKERTKIFEIGYRSKLSGDSVGSGLGLALGRELAQQFGGELTYSSEPFRFRSGLPKIGNTFILTFLLK